MLRIDAPQELTFVETERDGVVGLPRSWRPRGPLAGHHRREPVKIGDDAAIDTLVEREEAGLVGEELANGDALLAVLRELRPVRAHELVVVEQATRVRERESHRGEALGGGEDEDHRVRLPRLPGVGAADPTPEVDDPLAVAVHAAGSTDLAPAREVLREHFLDGLEALAHRPLDLDAPRPSPKHRVPRSLEGPSRYLRRWAPRRYLRRWAPRRVAARAVRPRSLRRDGAASRSPIGGLLTLWRIVEDTPEHRQELSLLAAC